MGFFDFLFKQKHPDKSKTAYASPVLSAPVSISAEEYRQHRLNEIDLLERKYNLSTVEGISAIPVPAQKEKPEAGLANVTGKIEYYLTLKAGQFAADNKVDLALACYRKANELMPLSSVEYGRGPYMRLPRYLRKLRRFDEARAEEAKIAIIFASGSVIDYGEDPPDIAIKRAEYDWLWEFLPDLCPKSFSAYSRMKNVNSEKYKQLVEVAANFGYEIK